MWVIKIMAAHAYHDKRVKRLVKEYPQSGEPGAKEVKTAKVMHELEYEEVYGTRPDQVEIEVKPVGDYEEAYVS